MCTQKINNIKDENNYNYKIVYNNVFNFITMTLPSFIDSFVFFILLTLAGTI